MDQIEKQTILIVDDTPEYIHVLDRILKNDFKIKAALDGEKALKIASGENPPDLILLDIMIPGMDGYEVCRRLKQNKASQAIPVIFVTGKTDFEDELKGFNLGAVDYITKPFEPAVVKARVRTQVELKMHRDHMEALAEARAQQLVHAERLSTLGMLSAGVAHEINNPLMFISGNADIIKIDLEDLQTALARALEQSNPQKQTIDAIILECKESLLEMMEGAKRITSLVQNIKMLSRRDDQAKANIDLSRCIENAMNLCQFGLKRIGVHLDVASNLPPVTGYIQQIEQVLINLLNNAVDALETVTLPEIRLEVKACDGNIRICLADNGPGINEDNLSAIWEAFYTTKAVGKGTGLGLSISKGIIEDHGGRIWAQNLTPQGACFIIELPFADTSQLITN